AKATNEQDYKYGFKMGNSVYSCYYEPNDSRCEEPVEGPQSHDANIFCHTGTATDHFHVANMTSCIDDYVNGFKHWCNTNTKDCAGAARFDKKSTPHLN